MRKLWTPSIVADQTDETFYVVTDRYSDGVFFREARLGQSTREVVLADLATGQYNDPQHVIAFNVREGWSRAVSREIAEEMRRRAETTGEELSEPALEFVERHSRPERQLSLKLVASR